MVKILEEAQLVTIGNDGWSIYNIKNPSLEVQLTTVKKNGLTLQYILEPDFEVQIAAVIQNVKALKYTTQEFKDLYPEYFL